MDEKRYEAAKRLLAAAHEFWKACNAEGQYGAVQWLTDTDGALIIFTRGEYKDRLMRNVDMLPSQVANVHLFGESMPDEGEQSNA